MLFDRSPFFLRAFDAACAAVFAVAAWCLHSWAWGISSALSALLCLTGASVHLQSAMQRALRRGVLALSIYRGVR